MCAIHFLRSIWICPEKGESLSGDASLSDIDDDDIRLLPEDYEITEKFEMVTLLEIHIISVSFLHRINSLTL
jgi:hypothetical protein